MKLLQLRLENFRQHADSTIDFRDGMTAIIGANGSGKSTLLESITFALYGEQRDKKETVRFYWAPARSRFRVALTFRFEGKNYTVERGENDASLTHHTSDKNYVLANGLRDVTTACERLTALSYEQFTNSFCAEQKGLAFLDFKTKGARQDEVARMLGFDRLKTAADLARDRAKSLRIRISTLQEGLGSETEVARALEESKGCLQEAIKARTAVQSRIAEIEKALPAAAERKVAAETFLKLKQEAIAIGGTAEGLKAALKHTEEVLESTRLDVVELGRVRHLDAEYREIEVKLKAVEVQRNLFVAEDTKRKRLEEAKAELALVEERIKLLAVRDVKALEAQVAECRKSNDLAQAELKQAEQAWRDKNSQAHGEMVRAAERLDQTRNALKAAEDLVAKGLCPECGQSTLEVGGAAVASRRVALDECVKETERVIKEAERAKVKPEALAALEAEVKNRLDASNCADKVLAESRSIAARAAAESEQGSRLRSQMTVIENDLASTKSNYEPLAHQALLDRAASLKPEHQIFLRLDGAETKLEAAKVRNAEAQKVFDEARAQYKKLEEARRALPFATSEEAQEAISTNADLLDQRKAADRDLANNEQLKLVHEKALAAAEARFAELKRRTEDMKAARGELALNDTTAKELLVLRENLNKSIRPDLEARASDNLSILTYGRYPSLTLDADFQPTLVEDDIPKPVISGGEEDVVALALRLALSELIQERQGRPMSLLILDEVFGSLDSGRRQSVLERLSAIKGRFTQILVISHIEEINQVADQCLYVTRDGETRSANVSDAPPEFELVAS